MSPSLALKNLTEQSHKILDRRVYLSFKHIGGLRWSPLISDPARNLRLWRACNLIPFKHSSTGPVVHPFASRHEGPGFNPQGRHLCETVILLFALSFYIGDPEVIDRCGLIGGRLRLELSLGRCTDNVIIPLDLTQLSSPGFTLAAGPPSGFTTT
jgi:hypothetical protein